MEDSNVLAASQPSETNSTQQTVEPVTQSNEVSEPALSEPVKQENDTITKDQMRVISADVKRRTEAKLRAEYEAQLNALRDNKKQESPENISQQEQVNIAGLTDEQLHQLYNNFKQRQSYEQQETEQQNVVNSFLTKVQSAGLGQKIESSGLGQLPVNHPLIPMLNSLDNVNDVIEDFDANPIKVANLLLVTNLNPVKGFNELQNLSNSIKRNKEALAKPKASNPPDQLKPSSYGLGNGVTSTADKRKNPLYKF